MVDNVHFDPMRMHISHHWAGDVHYVRVEEVQPGIRGTVGQKGYGGHQGCSRVSGVRWASGGAKGTHAAVIWCEKRIFGTMDL